MEKENKIREMISGEGWIWMPHAAHLIVAQSCQFCLATYVGDYIVSTVGEYKSSSVLVTHINKDGWDWDTVGYNRKYETMVFEAKPSGEECEVCPYVMKTPQEIDFRGYNDPNKAYEGHLEMCRKWAQQPINKD